MSASAESVLPSTLGIRQPSQQVFQHVDHRLQIVDDRSLARGMRMLLRGADKDPVKQNRGAKKMSAVGRTSRLNLSLMRNTAFAGQFQNEVEERLARRESIAQRDHDTLAARRVARMPGQIGNDCPRDTVLAE